MILETVDLNIGYKQPATTILEAVHVSLLPGQMVCLIGPNGAGKTTLLRTLSGVQPPLKGEVKLMGDNVYKLHTSQLAKRLSVVLTGRGQMGLLSGYELVALGRHPYTNWLGYLSGHDHEIIQGAIAAVGGENLSDRKISEMSDGERQKLMIARALAQEPKVMILDEPTAYLDLPRRIEVMSLLRSLSRKSNTAVLLSTHDLDLALRLADVIWLLPTGGPLHVGTPEDLVLDGTFADAFRREGVIFDQQSGIFQFLHDDSGTVALFGEGVHYVWTRRALEREGYTVVMNSEFDLPKIEIKTDRSDNIVWCLYLDGRYTKFETLSNLVNGLKQKSWAKSKERV